MPGEESATKFSRTFTFEKADYEDVCKILTDRERSMPPPPPEPDGRHGPIPTNGALLAGILREWEAYRRENTGKAPRTVKCNVCGRPMEAGEDHGVAVFRCISCGAVTGAV